jgi:hypothetical protein
MNNKIIFFLIVVLYAVWWGGFTFYAAIVVPQGMEILGDHVKMGLITQSVSNYLNGIGVIVLFISLLICIIYKPAEKNYLQAIGWQWFALVLLQAALFYVHSLLSFMIYASGEDIKLQQGFYNMHRIYLLVSTVMWLLIPVYFYKILKLNNYFSGQAK